LDCSATEEKEMKEVGKLYMRNLCTGKLNTILTAVLLGLEESSLLRGKTLFTGNIVHLSFQRQIYISIKSFSGVPVCNF